MVNKKNKPKQNTHAHAHVPVHTHTHTHTQKQYNLFTEQGIFNHYGKSVPAIFFMNFFLDGNNTQNYFGT
jgi:hypothetical protein